MRDPYTSVTSSPLAQEYFAKYPKDLFETQVEGWRDLQCYNIEFVMKRLREPKVLP